MFKKLINKELMTRGEEWYWYFLYNTTTIILLLIKIDWLKLSLSKINEIN